MSKPMESSPPRPAHIPMDRARAHLAAGRFAQAIGAFRAALGIEPLMVSAHFGLADAMVAVDRGEEAVDELVEAARTLGQQSEFVDAMLLLGKALTLEPARKELHLDVAFVEHAMGRREAAESRIQGLAECYLDEGRTEEAAELLRFVATWSDHDEAEAEPEREAATPDEPTPARNPGLDMAPIHTALISGGTVIAHNPMDDDFMLAAGQVEPETVASRVELEPIAGQVELEPIAGQVELETAVFDPDVTQPWMALPDSSPTAIPIDDAPEEPEEQPSPAVARVEGGPSDDELTVARAVDDPPARRVTAANDGPSARPVRARTSSGRLRLARAPRPGDPKPARPSLASKPVAAPPAVGARPIITGQRSRPRPNRKPLPRPAPSKRRRPAEPNPRVQRLRALAGLGDAAASPRGSRREVAESISILEDETLRFHRPRNLSIAAS